MFELIAVAIVIGLLFTVRLECLDGLLYPVHIVRIVPAGTSHRKVTVRIIEKILCINNDVKQHLNNKPSFVVKRK